MGPWSHRWLASILATSLAFSGTASAVPDGPRAVRQTSPKKSPIPPTEEERRKANWDEINRLKTSAVGSYLSATDSSHSLLALEKDLDASIRLGAETGVYGDTTGYRSWWERKKKSALQPGALRTLQDRSVAETAAIFYFAYVADTAFVLEAKQPGEGQKKIEDAIERAEGNSFWYIALGAAAAGFFGFIGKKVSDAFVFGPVTRVLNSALEPMMKPVLEKVDQLSSKYVAPRMVWWQKLLAGKKDIEHNDPVKYPGSTTAESARYEKELWDALLPAENISKSTMAKAMKEARATGLDLLYGQFTKLSDRLQNMEVAKRTAELHFVQIVKPQLGSAFSDESLEEFAELYRWRQDILTYENQLSEKASARDAEIEALGKRWRAAGATEEQMNKVFNHYADLYIMDNRPAFVLAEFLEVERLRPEDNMALSKDAQTWLILKRQEIGRQINGVYEVLTRHKDKIERLFKAFGTDYDVMDRVNERGHPFGGPARPRGTLPVKSCLELLQASEVGKSIPR